MPQLNPNPWFLTMLLSWFVLSFIFQPKLLTFISPNQPQPTSKTLTSAKPPSWSWPWT
uniref:ATP synthase complex subunit 8 n=1 Tax=Nyctyornis amictus TaxID=457351 RepID=A0A3G2LKJ0_9AVES|nr:ATP synthase F0 subunit 8 [Nyctyornis amictus]